ncbi:MAG TPA: M14 family metallopeptidase, partial [Burkholderiaceae bacterium]
MTATHPRRANSPLSTAPRFGRHWALPVLAAIAALLTACSSTPLPPWPDRNRPTPATSTPAATAPRAPAPAPSDNGVRITPIRPTDSLPAAPQPGTPSSAAPGAIQPDNAAVDARFPAPAVRYNTPGLSPERRSYTTNAELRAWLQNLAVPGAAPSGTRTVLLTIGNSQRGEPIEALLLTRAPGTSPDNLQAGKLPTVLLIGQQHGDEPASSEALLVIARELSQGLLEPLLSRINVIIVPRANPDGAEAGTRATANGSDMNHDHLLLSTPEAQALAQLTRDYFPLLVVDAHEFTVAGPYLQKFNAVQRYDALLQYATTANQAEFLTKASEEWLRRPLVAALNSQGLASDWYYTTSSDPQDATLSMGSSQPDTSRNANGLKNSVSLLIATRGVGIGRQHLQRRVHTQITAIASALQSTAERAANLQQVRSFVERDTTALACRGDMVVQAAPTPGQRNLTFIDPATGADKVLSVAWNSSLQLRTLQARPRPCGYWLSSAST